jgi:hypothetical protein
MRYHPRIGYTYMPSAKFRMPWEGSGYLVRTNASGFRSDREFVQERRPGTFRALLFGDSQTAGDGVANRNRFSDLLEQDLPGLETYNYAISGTGPDQQLLAYEEHATVEHDLLVIGVYVESIRRVSARITKTLSADGEAIFIAKPYYQIENQELVLHGVPVTKQPWTEQTLPAEYLPYVYPPHEQTQGVANYISRNLRQGLRIAVPIAPLRRAVKSAAMRLDRFRPVPDYDAPDNPAWLLLRRILETWIRASRTPVLLVPIPHYFFLEAPSDEEGYQVRFRELAESAGCRLWDPLPELLKLTAEEKRALWSDSVGHLSVRGHQTIARLLAPLFETFMAEARNTASSA